MNSSALLILGPLAWKLFKEWDDQHSPAAQAVPTPRPASTYVPPATSVGYDSIQAFATPERHPLGSFYESLGQSPSGVTYAGAYNPETTVARAQPKVSDLSRNLAQLRGGSYY